MIQLKTILDVADNTGARKASLIGVLKAKGKMWAKVGDIVRVNVKESTPDAVVKKGSMAKGIIVRTKKSIRRSDGTYVRFDSNAVVIIDDAVMIMAGRDKGKTGKVVRVLPKVNKAVIENINIVKKSVKKSDTYPQGGYVELEKPVHLASLMLVDKKTSKPTRF